MTRPIHVLLVDDNPADADLARQTLGKDKLKLDLVVVTDGVEALEFLWRKGRYVEAPRPDLILLDLNLPKKDGRQVLAEIKQHESLRRIPIVILSSSSAEKDIAKTYDLGANCYVTKPIDLPAFQSIVQSIQDFWFTVVKLPTDSP